MTLWSQGFCIGAIVTLILILLLCLYAALLLIGTYTQDEEPKQ